MADGDRMFATDSAGKHIRVGDTISFTPIGYGGAIGARVAQVFDDKTCRVEYTDRQGFMRDAVFKVVDCTGKARGDTGVAH